MSPPEIKERTFVSVLFKSIFFGGGRADGGGGSGLGWFGVEGGRIGGEGPFVSPRPPRRIIHASRRISPTRLSFFSDGTVPQFRGPSE